MHDVIDICRVEWEEEIAKKDGDFGYRDCNDVDVLELWGKWCDAFC